MMTGDTYDKSVQLSFTGYATNNWTFTAVKGTKTYTLDADIANNKLTVTSLVDSAA